MFKLLKKEDIEYFIIEEFKKFNVNNFFTTKFRGFSNYPKNSLNLGLNTQDNINNVAKNFQKLFKIMNIDIENVVPADQVHEDNIIAVNSNFKTKNFLKYKPLKNTDGIITNEKNIVLISFYADCVPLFFYDTKNKVVGLAHSGWKGTVKEIGKKTVLKMKEVYGSNPRNILVGIGPSIGPKSFEVSQNIAKNFQKYGAVNKIKDKYFVDLWKSNSIILQNAGILKENIIESNLDTYTNNELFFSYRRDLGNTGRMISCIYL